MIQDPARIERALRKAHEAGDTESAKKLAAAYKQAMAGTSPPAQTPPADPFASAPPDGGEGQGASAGQPLAPSTSPTGQAGALGGQPGPSGPGGGQERVLRPWSGAGQQRSPQMMPQTQPTAAQQNVAAAQADTRKATLDIYYRAKAERASIDQEWEGLAERQDRFVPNTPQWHAHQKKMGDLLDRRAYVSKREKDLQEYADEELHGAINDIIKAGGASLYMEREGVGKVADPTRIQAQVDLLSEKMGIQDEEFRKRAYNELISRVDMAPVAKRANEIAKEKIEPLLERERQLFKEGFRSDAEIAERATAQIKAIGAEIESKNKQEQESLLAGANEVYASITAPYKDVERRYEQAAVQIQQQIELGAIPYDQGKAMFDEATAQYEEAYAKYQEDWKAASDHLLRESSKAAARYNQQYQQEQKRILDAANKEITEAAEKYAKEFKGDPMLKERIKAAYEMSWAEATGDRAQAIEDTEEVRRLRLASKAPTFAVLDVFMRNTITGLGGAFKGISTTLGSDAGYLLGEEMERAYYMPQPKSKEWSDLMDPLNFSALSGQLAGAMAPSIVAAGVTAKATAGLGAPAAVQMVASALAGWGGETVDIAGRAKDQMMAQTGSMDKANEAWHKSFVSQAQLLPAYSFEGLPFVSGMLRRVPTVAGRVAAGAGIEYVTEIFQELPQNVAERNILEGKEAWDDFASGMMDPENKEVLIAMAPIALLGGGGQVTSKSAKTLLEKSVKDYVAAHKVSEFVESAPAQWMTGLTLARGEKFTQAVLASMHQNGTINEQQLAQLEQMRLKSMEHVSNARDAGLNERESNVYAAFAAKADELRAKAEDGTNPVSQMVAKARLSEIEKSLKDFVLNKEAQYVEVAYSDHGSTIMDIEEARRLLSDEGFIRQASLLGLTKDGITVNGFGAEGVSLADFFADRVSTTNDRIAARLLDPFSAALTVVEVKQQVDEAVREAKVKSEVTGKPMPEGMERPKDVEVVETPAAEEVAEGAEAPAVIPEKPPDSEGGTDDTVLRPEGRQVREDVDSESAPQIPPQPKEAVAEEGVKEPKDIAQEVGKLAGVDFRPSGSGNTYYGSIDTPAGPAQIRISDHPPNTSRYQQGSELYPGGYINIPVGAQPTDAVSLIQEEVAKRTPDPSIKEGSRVSVSRGTTGEVVSVSKGRYDVLSDDGGYYRNLGPQDISPSSTKLNTSPPFKKKSDAESYGKRMVSSGEWTGYEVVPKKKEGGDWVAKKRAPKKEVAAATDKAPEGEKKTTPTPQDTPAPPKPTTKAKITDPVVSTMVRSTESGSVEVTGQEYELPGFPQERFILHKDPDGPGWRVSESSTGMAIWAGATKAEALEAAQQRLSKTTPEKLRKAIEVQKLAQGQGPKAQIPTDRPATTGKLRTDKVAKALADFGVKIHTPKTQAEYDDALKNIGAEGISSSWGVYNPQTNEIFINPTGPDLKQTLGHEAAHPVLIALARNNPEMFATFADQVIDEQGGKYEKYAKENYGDKSDIQRAAEALAEFMGDVYAGRVPVSTKPDSLWQKFKAFIQDIMAALGWDTRSIDLSKPQNVRDFAAQFKKALDKGIKIGGLEGVTEGGPMMQIADIKGAVNIFGVDAVERDLATASNMEEGGKSPESIKLATGWERGVDGKWFYEIPDASLKDADTFAKALLSGKFDAESTIKDHFDAEEIFEAYPEIADYKIRIINEPSVGAEAEYSPIDKAITLNAARFIEEFKGRTPREVVARTNGMRGLRKVVAHELAHAVQDVSGFAAGGSPYMFDFVPADKRDATKVRELLSEYLEMTPEQKSERFGNLVAEGMTYWGPEKPEHQLRSLIDTSKTRVANAWGGEAKFLEWQVRLIDSLLRLPKWYMTSRQRYEALAGEVQARAVSAALDQSEQQRRSRTLKSLGSVPPEQQVVLSETPGTQAMMQKPSGATDAQWAGAVDAAVQAYTDSILEGNEDAQSLKAAMAAAAKTKGWGEMTKEARVAADRELRSMFEKASASQEKGTPSISGRRLRAEKEPTPKEKADIIAERLKHTPEKQDDVAGEVNSIIDQAFSDGMTLQQVEELIEAADTSPSNKMYARGRLHFEADKAAHDRALSQAERLEAAELSARMVNRMAKFGMEGGRANAMFYRVMKDFSTFSFDVNLKAAQQKADKLFNTPVEGVPLKDRIAEIQAALKKALAEDGDLSKAIGLIGKLNDILDQYATDLSKTTLKPGQHQDTSLAEAVRSPSKFAAKIRALEEALRAAKADLARMKKNGRPQDVIDKAGARVEEIEKLRAELESLREGIKEERKEYDEKLTQYERLIAELVNRNIPKTKDGPLSSGKVQSKAVKALLEASLAGVMTQDFYKNLSEAFGLPYITPQMRAVLRALSDAVHEFQKGGQRELARRAMRALNTQVRKMTPKDAEFYYTLFDEMLHTNILSGINTFFNANQGSLFESMYAFAGLNISHLAKGNFGALAYAYGKLLRPEGLRTGRNKALNYTMAYDDLGSYFEGEAKRGMGAYEEFLKLGVAQGLAMAKDGEMKKGVTRLIGSLMLQGVNFAFNIRAIDAMLTHSFAEFQYALKDYDKIMKEMGVSNHMSPMVQVLSRMNPVPALKKLSQDGVQYQAALDQARKEVEDLKARGFKIGRYGFVMATKAINEKLAERWVNGYIKRRAQEILENDRDHDAMNSAIRMGKDSILMGDPDGVSGWLSERVASAFSTNKFNQASTPGKMAMVAFRATGLFFRVMANSWGRVVHNTPVIGAIAATYGLSKDPKTDKWTFGALWKRDPQRFKLRLASNALASAFVLAAWNMMFDLADDDDDDEDVKKIPFLGTRMKLNPDRLIDLTANAYSRYDKNMGISEDYQMFSIRFRTPEQAKAGEWGTPWLSMRLIPSLGGPLATVGRMADDVKGYGGLKEGEEENLSQRIRRETKWGTAAFGVLGQSSFNAIGRTVNKFNYASDIDQAYAGVIQDIALSPVTAMAQPTFYRDVINEAMFLADKPAKQRRRVHGMADLPPNFFGSLYGLDNLLFEDKVDRFGNPVPRVEKFSDNLKAFTGYQSNADRYPEVALLFKYEDLPLPAPDYRPSTIAGNEPDPRKPGSSLKLVLTGEEKERINAYHKQFLRAIVRMDYLPDGEWEGLETLGRDDLSAYLKNATLMAKEFARAQLVAERDGDTEVAKAIVDANEQAQQDLERIREAKK